MANVKNKTDSLSNNDLDKIANLLDSRLAPLHKRQDDFATKLDLMATKQDLKQEIAASEQRMKAYIHEGIETVMDGMDKLSEDFVEKKRVDKIEGWTKQIARKVGVKLV